MTKYVEYDSNNSGGSWWMSDSDWHALENAGWVVRWSKYSDDHLGIVKKGRYMGALATSAYKVGVTLREAIREFDSVTSCTSSSLGCSCCGTPHSFRLVDGDPTDGSYGNTLESWSPEYPEYGDDY